MSASRVSWASYMCEVLQRTGCFHQRKTKNLKNVVSTIKNRRFCNAFLLIIFIFIILNSLLEITQSWSNGNLEHLNLKCTQTSSPFLRIEKRKMHYSDININLKWMTKTHHEEHWAISIRFQCFIFSPGVLSTRKLYFI